ncbi:MAG: hypothetical protein AAF846_14275 [Chloroflexota bacterium]
MSSEQRTISAKLTVAQSSAFDKLTNITGINSVSDLTRTALSYLCVLHGIVFPDDERLNIEGNLIHTEVIPFGLEGYKRTIEEYSAKNTSTVVRILETFTTFVSSSGRILEDYLSETENRLEILLLDPQSPIAEQRSLDLGEKSDFVAKSIEDTLKDIEYFIDLLTLRHKDREKVNSLTSILSRIEIRFYDSWPGLALYQVDDITYIAFYTNRRTAQGPYLKLYGDNSNHIEQLFQDNWQQLWNSSTGKFNLNTRKLEPIT